VILPSHPAVACACLHAVMSSPLLIELDSTSGDCFCRSPTISFKAPMPERIADFHRILRQEYGVPCTVRQEKVQRHAMHLSDLMSPHDACCRHHLPCAASSSKGHYHCLEFSNVRLICRDRTSAAPVGSLWWRPRKSALTAARGTGRWQILRRSAGSA
jgi:hypothetical protein